jgi:hypothetical protein
VIKRLGVAAVILGLAFPAGASAHHQFNHWKWGYNWFGPAHGIETKVSGFAGWDDIWVDKTSGGYIRYGFLQPGGYFCDWSMNGNDTKYRLRTDSICDPYVAVAIQHDSGNDSYLYFDTYNYS